MVDRRGGRCCKERSGRSTEVTVHCSRQRAKVSRISGTSFADRVLYFIMTNTLNNMAMI
jgi:hypothetical protein